MARPSDEDRLAINCVEQTLEAGGIDERNVSQLVDHAASSAREWLQVFSEKRPRCHVKLPGDLGHDGAVIEPNGYREAIRSCHFPAFLSSIEGAAGVQSRLSVLDWC
jgi:hypothetical protein